MVVCPDCREMIEAEMDLEDEELSLAGEEK